MSAVDFERFGHLEALELGQRMLAAALDAGQVITIALWLGDQRVFHAALPGTSADNDAWVERKRAIVRRYDKPSWATAQYFREHGLQDQLAAMGLDPLQHALSGGGVPLQVRGTTVGVLVVSGLTDAEDHDVAVASLEVQRKKSGAVDWACSPTNPRSVARSEEPGLGGTR